MPSTYNFTGGVISQNEADCGGGVYVHDTGNFIGTSDQCTLDMPCTGTGGCSACTMSLDDHCAIIVGNVATDRGGGVFNGGSTQLETIVLDNNKANLGGGIYATASLPSENVLTSLGLYQNQATSDGGAIYLETGAVLTTVGGTEFVNNQAAGNGGAIYADPAEYPNITTDSATYFCGNSAQNAVIYPTNAPSSINWCTLTVWENALNNYDISATGDALANPCGTPNFTINPDGTPQKQANPLTPLPGSIVTYTVTLTNTGTSAAPGLHYLDQLPAGVTLSGTTATATLPDGSTQTLSNVGSLTQPEFDLRSVVPVGGKVVLTYEAAVAPTVQVGEPLTNTVTISTPEGPPGQPGMPDIPAPGQDPYPPATSTVIPGQPKFVSAQKTADPTNPVPNSIVLYTITDQNTGTAPAATYTLSDQPPAGVTLSGTPTANITFPDGTVQVVEPIINPNGSFTIPGPIPVNAYIYLAYEATVSSDVASGVPLTNTATPTYTDEDDNPYHADPVQATITPDIPTMGDPQKNVTPPLTEPGSVLTYEINAINNGALAATSYTIADTMPNSGDGSVTYIPGSVVATVSGTAVAVTEGGTATNPTFSIGNVPSGASVQFLYQGQIAPTVPPGTTLTNQAVATYTDTAGNTYTGDPVEASSLVNAPDFPDPIKTVAPSNPAPGSVLTYTIDTTNTGSITAQTYTISDILPNNGDGSVTYVPGSAVVTISGAVAPVTVNGTSTNPVFTTGPVPVGAHVVLLYQATVASRVTAGTELTNVASPSYTDPSGNTYTGDPATATAIVHTPTFSSPEKTVTPDNPLPGQTLTYTIQATNNSDVAAKTFTINDLLPNNGDGSVTLVPSSAAATIAGQTASVATTGSQNNPIFTLGPVPPGANVLLTYQAQVANSVAPGTSLLNTATPSHTDDQGNTYPGSPVTAEAIVNLLSFSAPVKTASPDITLPGGITTYTVTITNASSHTAQSFSLQDLMPNDGDGSITYVPDSVSATVAGNQVPVTTTGTPTHPTFTIGAVPPNSTITFQYQGIAARNLATPATLTNKATPSYVDAAGSTHTAPPASATVTAQSPSFSLATKTVNPPTVAPGDTLNYTVHTTNTSPHPVQNFTITDNLPPSTTYTPGTATALIAGQTVNVTVGGTSQNPTFNLGNVPAGATVLIQYQATVAPNATAPATLINTATPTYQDQAGNPYTLPPVTATATLSGSPELLLTKTTPIQTVEAGGEIPYSLTLTNNGNDIAQAPITISDQLPTGLQMDDDLTVTLNGVPIPFQTSPNHITLNQDLRPGQTLQLSFTANVSNTLQNGTTLQNTAIARAQNVTSNLATAETVTIKTSVLTALKTATPTTVAPGNKFSYTVHITNTGSQDAPLSIIDQLPDGVLLDTTKLCHLTAQLNGSPTNVTVNNDDPQNPTFTFPDNIAANGGTASITLPVILSPDAPAGATLNNIAQVNSGTNTIFTNPAPITVLEPSTLTACNSGRFQANRSSKNIPLTITNQEGTAITRVCQDATGKCVSSCQCRCQPFRLAAESTYKINFTATAKPSLRCNSYRNKCQCSSIGVKLDNTLFPDSVSSIACGSNCCQLSHTFILETGCDDQFLNLTSPTNSSLELSNVCLTITKIN